MRCTRCGRDAAEQDKFCAECGMLLRDALVDHRLLHALVPERDGRHRDARRELERLVEADPDNAIANHMLGTVYFHQGALDKHRRGDRGGEQSVSPRAHRPGAGRRQEGREIAGTGAAVRSRCSVTG